MDDVEKNNNHNDGEEDQFDDRRPESRRNRPARSQSQGSSEFVEERGAADTGWLTDGQTDRPTQAARVDTLDRQTDVRSTGRIRYNSQASQSTATDGEFTGLGEHRRQKFRRKSNSPAILFSSVARNTSMAPSSSVGFKSPSPSVRGDVRGGDEPSDERLQLVDDPLSDESSGSMNFCTMKSDKKFTVVTFCLTNFCVGAFYSLLAPFFPTEAAKKGANATIVGLIFATFEMTLFLMAPIFGSYMTRIGARFMYLSGVMFCGCSAILFGFLDECPDGVIYIVMCFIVRFFEALGASAFSTASFAIMANTFPQNVAAMFGSLEMFSGLGLMVGPPIGGALFQLGGFKLPFISLRAVVLLVGIISAFLLPHQEGIQLPSDKSVLSLLKIPLIPIVGFCLLCGAGSLGFLDVTLSLFLTEQYQLSPIIVGVVFLVGPGVYAFTAPVWGWLSDKYPSYNLTLLCIGYTISGLALFFVGPAPFFPIGHMLWLQIISMAVMGFGVATLVIVFPVITETALAAGNPDNLATYGLIAGVFNAFFSLGACIGPLFGGFLHDTLKFEMAAVVVGCIEILAVLILLTYLLVTYCIKKPAAKNVTEQSEKKQQPQSVEVDERLLLRENGHTRQRELMTTEQLVASRE